jgi:hypothetical protein
MGAVIRHLSSVDLHLPCRQVVGFLFLFLERYTAPNYIISKPEAMLCFACGNRGLEG